MDKEYEVLDNIAKDKNITQRKIAERAGLSLGAANILIKRLIKKGLVKVEQINSRTLRYILTPAGIVEKTKRTYQYIVYSYGYITRLNSKIKFILEKENNVEIVYLYGKKDEVYEIIINALHDVAVKWIFVDITKVDSFPGKNDLVIVWDTEKGRLLEEKGMRYVNVLAV